MRQLSLGLTALLASAVLVAAGCGGEEEARGLAQSRADTLLELLDQAEQQFEDGECDELNETLTKLAEEVNGVDNEVDESVRTALDSETQELVDLASQDCEEPETVTTPTVTETLPVPTTVPETTAPTTTEETETQTEEEEPPEDGSEGQGPEGEGPPGQEENSGADSSPPPEDSEESAGERPGGSTSERRET